jgi:NAD(P)H dehydrogenase (quinone)
MTKTLIVYAHPNVKVQGYCSTILKEVVARLKKHGIEYELLDLYKMKFDPVLHEDELYTAGKYKVSKECKKIQEMISQAYHIVLIYPLWWNGAPAIMKGFFDRVLTSHFAYKYDERGIPHGLLTGKKVLVYQTSGASEILSRIFQGDRGAKVVAKDTCGFCGMKAKVFRIGNAEKLNDKQISEIKNKIEKGFDWLYK